MMSVPPPAACELMNLIGRSGQVSAFADTAADTANATGNSQRMMWVIRGSSGGWSEFLAHQVVERPASAAAEKDRERNDAHEQGVFHATLAPGPVRPQHGKADDGHFDGDGGRHDACEQAGCQHD